MMCMDQLFILNTAIFHKKQAFNFNLNCSCSASYCTTETNTKQAAKETAAQRELEERSEVWYH